MSSKDDLQFHDSGGDDVLFDTSDGQTHTFTNFPHSAVDIEEEEEGGDKSKLLEGDRKNASFWTFEYYQQLFDVDTRQVFQRVAGSMLPLPNKNYLQHTIRPNPDLYGPFWICTTLVFTTAIAGNLANYLASGGAGYQWRYDFHKVTFAASAIFSYWWLIPALLYGILWWRKSEAGYTFMEILCVYGYSLAIYIPISILWVVNISWLQWTLVVLGTVLSGGVLVLTFWPAVKQDSGKVAAILSAVIFILHLALAAGFVLYFFHIPAVTDVSVQTTVAPDITTKAALLKLATKPESIIDHGGPKGTPLTQTEGNANKPGNAANLQGADVVNNPLGGNQAALPQENQASAGNQGNDQNKLNVQPKPGGLDNERKSVTSAQSPYGSPNEQQNQPNT